MNRTSDKAELDTRKLFKSLKTEVHALGAQSFRGWDKKEWISRQKRASGMKEEKRQKIPTITTELVYKEI